MADGIFIYCDDARHSDRPRVRVGHWIRDPQNRRWLWQFFTKSENGYPARATDSTSLYVHSDAKVGAEFWQDYGAPWEKLEGETPATRTVLHLACRRCTRLPRPVVVELREERLWHLLDQIERTGVSELSLTTFAAIVSRAGPQGMG